MDRHPGEAMVLLLEEEGEGMARPPVEEGPEGRPAAVDMVGRLEGAGMEDRPAAVAVMEALPAAAAAATRPAAVDTEVRRKEEALGARRKVAVSAARPAAFLRRCNLSPPRKRARAPRSSP